MTFGIIGYGNFGKLLANILSEHGSVFIHDSKSIDEVDNIKPTSHVSFEQAASCNVVILAVGIESLASVCEKLADKVTPQTIVLDVCSVKVLPVEIMTKYLAGKCQLLATHPLFGPQTVSGVDLVGKKIVLYPIDFINYDVFRVFLQENLCLEVIELSPEEHDKEMAWVHALTFYVGRGLMRLNPPASKLTTGYYQKLIDLVELEKSHSIELFNTVELGNPFAKDVRDKFNRTLNDIENELTGKSIMSSLENIRNEIDKIDDELLDLLNKRAKLALEVKKTGSGKTPIRPERENSIVRRLTEKNSGPVPDAAVRAIFTQIIASFRDQMQLDRPISVSYLGPAGTYSEEAARKLFGSTIDHHPEDTISAVLRSVEAGSSQLALVPIENSSEGAIRETHRLLMDTNLQIVSEITLPVVHCLLTSEDRLNAINVVYGHPQALGQCRTWLATHLPSAQQISTASNAVAAELASKNKKCAAVASKKAGEIYKLQVVEHGINDQPGNKTRFIALGALKTQPTGFDKTSIICVLNDKPGALHALLGILAEKNISMSRLESQPYETGKYAFYIDFAGHLENSDVAKAIEDIDKLTRICRILGSYSAEVNER